MNEFFSFLHDLKSNPAIIILTILLCGTVFLIWQVTNHLPTQIEEIKEDIKGFKEEIKEDIKGLDKKFDRKFENIDRKFDDIYKILIEIKNK